MPTVTIPLSRATSSARRTEGERPDVVIPNSTSPLRPRPASGRAKTSSKPKSFPAAVKAAGSSVSANAGQESRATLPRRRISNSVARCWESAADPPLPQNISLFPARIAASQASTMAITGSGASARACFSAAPRRSSAAICAASPRSVGNPATVDGKGRACDGRSRFGAEKSDKGADLAWRGEFEHRLLLCEQRLGLVLHRGAVRCRPCLDLRLDERRQDPAGTDRIYRDAVVRALDRNRLGRPDHAVLRRDIGDLLPARDQSMSGGNIDDPPPTAPAHQRHRGLHCVKYGGKVERDDCIPLLVGKILDRCHMLDPGIVHQNIDRAEVSFGPRHQSPDLRRAGQIRPVECDANTKLPAKRGPQILDFRCVAEPVQHDVRTLCSQRTRNAKTDTAGRTGYQRNLAPETHGYPQCQCRIVLRHGAQRFKRA